MNKLKEAKKLLKAKDLTWSKAIHNKYNNRCACCGRTEYLNAHHIISRQHPNKTLRHDERNGILICSKCHLFSRTCSAHKQSFQFMIWLMFKYTDQFNYLLSKVKGDIK